MHQGVNAFQTQLIFSRTMALFTNNEEGISNTVSLEKSSQIDRWMDGFFRLRKVSILKIVAFEKRSPPLGDTSRFYGICAYSES